jgi:hypothetical protein
MLHSLERNKITREGSRPEILPVSGIMVIDAIVGRVEMVRTGVSET